MRMRPLWGLNGLFNWWSLRSVGNLIVLKVSYPTLALTPFISQYKQISQFLHIYNNKITLSAFFASLALAIANLLYDIFCPVIVKRFDSPNTLYKEMLDIKLRSLLGEPNDKFDSSLDHCRTAYHGFAVSKLVPGLTCAFFYVTALALFAFIFLDRVWVVARGIIYE
jgi:hypothetical protein